MIRSSEPRRAVSPYRISGINTRNSPVVRTSGQSPEAEIPSRKFRDEAFEYVVNWCKASADYVGKKIERWKLLEDLYHNRRDLNSWSAGSPTPFADNRAELRRTGASRNRRWQSDIILAPSYIVDSWVDRAYQAIFSGPDWIGIVPESPGGKPKHAVQYPASFKLQELLLSRLSQGQIHVRLYEILQHLVLYGTVFAKVIWYSKDVTRHRWNPSTLEVVEARDVVYDCPVLQVIPLDRILVDWTATHSDVQRHTGIGHRVDKTHTHILEHFDRGAYNLNKDAFLSRWKEGPAGGSSDPDGLLRDEDATDLDSDRIRKHTAWEWHGTIPTSEGHRECLCTIITEQGAETPEDGIMVRLTTGPVLWSGLRPFLCAHYTPLAGPFGMGAVESNLDLIHAISQFISQSQDNARLTANAQLIVRRGSSAARQISTDDDVVYPGKVWTVDDPEDIKPFPNLNFPQQDVNTLINYLNGLLEKRTTISDMQLGVSTKSKSATEAHILHEAAMAPFASRADLFARSFLEPLGRLALSMLQQFLLEDQTITVKDLNGQDMPIVVTSSEIQSGSYRVVATLTRQESTRIAKAQSIERALPTLEKFQPLLAQEGIQISFSELLKRFLDLIGVEGADRIFTRMSNPTADSAEGIPGAPTENAMGMSTEDISPPLGDHGGSIGPMPTDAAAFAQWLQMQADSPPSPQSTGGNL